MSTKGQLHKLNRVDLVRLIELRKQQIYAINMITILNDRDCEQLIFNYSSWFGRIEMNL